MEMSIINKRAEKYKSLVESHFRRKSFISSDIESYNYFIEHGLQQIIDELEYIEPAIIPEDIEELKIKFENIRVKKPKITEADGSERQIYPVEARLRNITYSATVLVDVSTHINGTERVLIDVEDLAPNKMFIEMPSIGTSKYVGKLFSQKGTYRIPHLIECPRSGIYELSFTRVRKIPLVIVLKALGLLQDEEVMRYISSKKDYDGVMVNLYNFSDVKTQDDALDFIAKKLKSTKPREIRIQRMQETMDKYLLPHLGTEAEDRLYKAHNLCKLWFNYLRVQNGEIQLDDKDHYMNKRLKLGGELLEELFRTNLRSLIKDLLYNFQRVVKRGKFPSIKAIIRDKLLTSNIYSSMATGNWVGGRKGISQRLQRTNHLDAVSHLQRVVSPLSPTQENFEGRALHSTHLGRLCPIETPEGTNIGLRKNLSLLAEVSKGLESSEEEKLMQSLRNFGLRSIR